ncbi:MAG: MMPL family transporter [Pseudomonadota bacterium]
MADETELERLGRRFAEKSVAYRWALVPLIVVLCVAISYGASTLRFAGDYRVFFGAENPDFIANERAQATFGKPDNLAFVVIPKSGDVFTEDTLTAVYALTEAAWRLPFVSRVDSLTNFQNTRGEQDELIVEDLVFDPSALSPADIEAARATAMAEPLVKGFVVSNQSDATVVNATLQLPADFQNVSTRAAAVARKIRAEVLAAHPDHEIHLTGVASLSASFEEAGASDSQTLIPFVYLIILVVIFAVIRSLTAVLATLSLILLSTLVGMGVGGWTGVLLTPISLSAPIIILTIAVADAIHVIAGVRAKMEEGASKRDAIVASVSLNFSPILITSLTTIVGFLALNFSDSPPFHHLGNISAAGIFAAWILSVTFLPALLSMLPLKFEYDVTAPTPTSARIARALTERPKTFAICVSALLVACAAFVPTIQLNDQWSRYFDKSLEFRQAIDASEPYFGSDQVEFVLDPGAPGDVVAPAFLNRVDAFAEWLRADPAVAHVFAISDIMKRVNRNLNGDDPAFYAIPEEQATASQYLLVYELSLPYGLDLNNRVDIDRQTTRVTATVRDISTEDTKAFLDRAEAWFAENGGGYGYEATGSKVLFAFVAQRNIEAMFEGAGVLVLAIFAILAIAFRSLGLGALSVLTNAAPIAATFGVWALLVGTVGFSVAAVGAVAVGLVVDFTVHFLSKYRRARDVDGVCAAEAVAYAYRTAGAAIFATTMILAAGFSVLAFSAFKLNADLGLLTALAVVASMIVNLVLLPCLLVLFDRRQRAGTLQTV